MNTAPIGWGFPEGYPLDGIGPESLPDLPFLKVSAKLQKERRYLQRDPGRPAPEPRDE